MPDDDLNVDTREDFGFFVVNQRNGERMSSVRSSLHPAAHRLNLRLSVDELMAAMRACPHLRRGRGDRFALVNN